MKIALSALNQVACAALVLCTLSACAAYPGDALPKRPSDFTEKSRVTSVDYEIPVLHSNGEDSAFMEDFDERLERQLEQVFTRAEPGIGLSPLHLVVSFEAYKDQGPFLLGFVSAVTLLLVPHYRETEFTLRVEARWKEAAIGSYVYTDSMETWNGWIYLPKLFDSEYSRRTVAGVVIDNMIANLVADLARDTRALP